MPNKVEAGSIPLSKPQYEDFCRYFILWNKDTYWNQTASYLAAYYPEDFFNNNESARNKFRIKAMERTYNRTRWTYLMNNKKLIARINYLLKTKWFSVEAVDAHLQFVIEQFWDLQAKNRAISEYNKISGRITNKIDIISHNAEENPLENRIKDLMSKKTKK